MLGIEIWFDDWLLSTNGGSAHSKSTVVQVVDKLSKLSEPSQLSKKLYGLNMVWKIEFLLYSSSLSKQLSKLWPSKIEKS